MTFQGKNVETYHCDLPIQCNPPRGFIAFTGVDFHPPDKKGTLHMTFPGKNVETSHCDLSIPRNPLCGFISFTGVDFNPRDNKKNALKSFPGNKRDAHLAVSID